MKLIKKQQFNQVYQLFEESFIPAELRPYDLFFILFEKDEMKIYIEDINNKIIAAVIVWEFDDYIYIENFAVNQSMRGQGIGGKILETLKSMYPHQQIILEVEEAKDDISQKRIEFYQRHQWILNPFHYIQPPLRKNVDDVHLYLMSYPNAMSEKQFYHIKEELFNRVYQQNYRK